MGENHSFLALDWVKGEIEETLKQARQALEAHVENPDDPTRMRFCLAYLHQVYGTLHMVEFYGAALLAEEMEKLCQALVSGKVAKVDDGQEVLMRAILQLPPYLERVKASRRDLPVVLLPLLNDLRAVRGEPLMSETALFAPDLAAGARAPIQIAGPAPDPVLLKKIRQMYQIALLGLIKQDRVADNLAHMEQVFGRLERIAGASPMRELWQVAAALVEGLGQQSIEAGTSVKMLLGHVDRQLRGVGGADDAERRPPTELMKNLLYYIAKSPGQSPRLRGVKDLYRLNDALPADNLVNEERARMAGPDREAIKSVVEALGDELSRVKDGLDIFVRNPDRKLSELGQLVPILKQVADTVAMLGLGQPRRILQEQIEAIDSITSGGQMPPDTRLLDIAGALLYVEATLNGMVADKTVGGRNKSPDDIIDLSGQKQLSDAQGAVLRESRGALERSKDAVIEFIASQWNPVHLEAIPEQINTVRGGLIVLDLPRPAELLSRASQYISERLLKDQYRPDWPEMDTLADIITSVEYYLERVANDGQGGEAVLDIAEAGLNKLGFGRAPAAAAAPVPAPEPAAPEVAEAPVEPAPAPVPATVAETPAAMADLGMDLDFAAAAPASPADLPLTPPPAPEVPVIDAGLGGLEELSLDDFALDSTDVHQPVPTPPASDFAERELDSMADTVAPEAFARETLPAGELPDFDLDMPGLEPAPGADDITAVRRAVPTPDDTAGPTTERQMDDAMADTLVPERFARSSADSVDALDDFDLDALSLDLPEAPPAAAATPLPPVSEAAPEDDTLRDISLEDLELAGQTLPPDRIEPVVADVASGSAAPHPLEGEFSLDEFALDDLKPLGTVAPAPALPVADSTPPAGAPSAPEPEPVLETDALLDSDLVLEDFTLEPVTADVPVPGQESAADDAAAETVVLAASDAEESFDLDAFTLDSAPGAAEVDAEPEAPAEPEPEPVPAPAPVVAAPAPAAAPKKPILPVLTVMPEDDFDFDDEEIREIFVEEAQEVLETINEYFPRWAGNFEEHDALVEFRRGFHTLKGSGRMVGAKVVAELAWSIENMLNKVRDKVLAPNQAMVNLISECLAVIPGLVEDFHLRQPPRINTSTLMASADALSRGEDISTVDVARAAEDAHEPEAEPAGSAEDFDALAASLAPLAAAPEMPAPVASAPEPLVAEPELVLEPEPEFIVAAAPADLPVEETLPVLEPVAPAVTDDSMVAELPADAFAADAGNVLEDMESFLAEDTPLASLDEPTTPATADVDPVLLEIFTSEADAHLGEIQRFLDALDAHRSGVAVSDQVLRSLHTLKGSAGMAGIAPVADVAAPMEHLFKDLRNQGAPANRDHLQALRRVHDSIKASIDDLLAGGSGRIPDSAGLIARIRELDQERLQQLEKQERKNLGMEDSGNWAEAVTAATAGRVASFMALGLDHVLDAPWELDGWLGGDERDAMLQLLREELLRLAPAARRAELEPLALIVERLASLYSRLLGHTLPLEQQLIEDLCAGHDEIINIFDTLAASQTVEPNERVLNTLLDWLEMPELAAAPVMEAVAEIPTDEPAAASFETEEPRQGLAESMHDGFGAEAATGGLGDVPEEPLDPELLEIFLEEAEEVVEAADGELSDWKADPSNHEPLAVLQRQLHTLKGGARLAEIKSLGDLAHELEFLYEGLVDGRYEASSALIDLVRRCHDRLADMVSALREGGRCQPAPDLLNAITSFRRGGEVVEPVAAAPAPVVVEPEVLPESAATPSPEPAFEPAALEPAFEAEPEPEVAPADEYVEHIPWDSEPVSAHPPVGLDDVLPEGMDEGVEFFDDALTEPEPQPEPEVGEMVPPAAPAEPAAPTIAEASPSWQPPVAAPTPAPAVVHADFDPELLEIFLEEAGELVDSTSEQLSQWLSDTNNTLPVQELQRGLHTLKGGARMAEITPLGDLAHQMEDLYEGLCDGVYSVTPPLLQLLHRCHDRLAQAVELLQKGQGCPVSDDLVAQLRSYIADPQHYQDVPVAVSLAPHVPEPEAEPFAAAPAPVVAPAPVELPPRAIEAAEVPEQVDADILEIFFEESEELTESIEASINDWLADHDDPEPLESLLRHLHTLKGGARLAGLKELGNLAHDFESSLVGVQNGSREPDAAFFNGLNARFVTILDAIEAVRAVAPAAAVAAPVAPPTAPVPEPEATVAEPAAAPAPASPSLASLMEAAPQAPALAGERAVPPPMTGSFRNLQGNRGPQEMIRVPSDLLEKLVNLAGETSITRSRVEMGVHGFAQTVEEMGATIQRLADQLRRMDSEMETQIISRHNEELTEKYEDFDPLEMDQYSSLNQLSKALSESASDLLDLKATLIDKARDTETLLLQQSRINTELQEGLMRSRMVPFSRLVPRLKRIVRQTGQEVNKPADLDVINAEGEMDRTLLERVVAPLEHMLRNAVDHGIEKPEGRAAAGKPAQGKVTLSLAREGGEVVLTLSDDGAGINVAAVRRKAIERGLVPEGSDISDAEVIQFIFHAGFSTAEKVTQISGRGVGMDVVQSEIKQMGGVVSIASHVGQGTTFTIRLPFTVAVSRALMVRIGEDVYAIPLSQIEGIVRASPYELEAYYAPGAPLFEYAGVAYRLNYLGEFVHGVKSPNLVGHVLPLPVLLVRGGEQRVAIQVDQLIGSREIVVKSVGMQLSSVAGISGATILGDGSVVIILDVVAMLRAAAISQPRVSVSGQAPALEAPAAPEVARARTVMVVDDSVTVRKVTSRLLERHGYEVLLAKDGMDAIAKLEDQKPDIMLLDIEMPRMDGFEVASLVRHNPNLEDLPIIMITSRTGEKHRERAFQIGVNCYMGKPFQEQQLLDTIGELLSAATVR